MPETQIDSNPTLSPDEIAKVHALAAERQQRRKREQQDRMASERLSAKREAERKLLASLEGVDEESTAAATAARQKAAAKADLAAHNRAVEAARVAAAKSAQAAIVKAETVRARALTSVAAKAAKLGVPFDLLAALKSRVSASAALDAVLNAAADADEADAINTYCGPSATDISNYDRGNRPGDSMAGGWSKALERAAARSGL